MTDDITRGLGLLADDAEPAPIDTHALAALARARTNSRRAVVASACVTLAAIGALAVAVGSVKEPPPLGADNTTTTATSTSAPTESPAEDTDPTGGRGPVFGTEVEQPASKAERTERAQRLQRELTDAFGQILPDAWTYSAFRFACDPDGCWARGDIVDDVDNTGPIKLSVHVSGDYGLASCTGADCTKKVLEDGTLVAFSTREYDGRVHASMGSVRPDGTSVSISADWAAGTTPPLTDDQWRAFGNLLTY